MSTPPQPGPPPDPQSGPRPDPVPPGYTAVTPWIVARGAAGLLDFLAEAFGAQELGRVPGPGGLIGHAETRLGDAVVMVFDAREGWPETPALLRLYVDDLDDVLARATAAGARVVTPATPMVFGDVVARLADPWGNLWWLHERVEEVEVTELVRRMEDPDALATMTAFEDSLDAEMRRRADTPSREG